MYLNAHCFKTRESSCLTVTMLYLIDCLSFLRFQFFLFHLIFLVCFEYCVNETEAHVCDVLAEV